MSLSDYLQLRPLFVLLSLLAFVHSSSAEDPLRWPPLPGENFYVDGHEAFIIRPGTKIGNKQEWLWYAPAVHSKWIPGGEDKWLFTRLLSKGIAVAGIDVGESFGNTAGRKVFSSFYEELIKKGFSSKPCLLARSRGALMLYNWATEHPTAVGCIVGIFPVMDIRTYPGVEAASSAYGTSPMQFLTLLSNNNPIDRLAPLAASKVPILHVYGDADDLVPPKPNSIEASRRYESLGGVMELRVMHGHGHEISPTFFENEDVVQYIVQHLAK